MPAPPRRLRASSRSRDLEYRLADDLVALHRRADKTLAASADVVAELPEAVVVRRGAKKTAERGGTGPVYHAGDPRTLAVPTGKLFVRLKKGLRASARRTAFARAGYEIVGSPSYAPNAAWLAPATGTIAEALSNIGRVERIAGVVNVEPELLRQRVAR
jgi:hypothetical protein